MSDQLTLTEETYSLTVVEDNDLQLTLSGERGPAGTAGVVGAAGPNTITTSTTAPSLAGYIFGNGTTIAGATAAASAATANTLVLRTSGGAASFVGITNTGTLNLATGTTFTYGTGIALAHRNALGLGSLATQNGTFSGTSSGTNTGDQDLSGYLPVLSSMEVTGLGSSGAFGDVILEDSALTAGKRSWTSALSELYYTGTDWNFSYNDGANSYQATVVSTSDEPWKLDGWTILAGTGDPSFVVFPSALQPVNASGTIAVVADQQGRVSPYEMTGLGGGVSAALAIASDTDGGFLTAGVGGPLPIERGGTGSTIASDARIAFGAGTTGAELFGAATAAAARTTMGMITATSTAQIDSIAYSIGGASVTGLQNIQLEADTLYEVSWYGKFTSNGGSGYLWLNFSSPYDDLGNSAFQQFARFHTTTASVFLVSTSALGAAFANLGTQTNRTAHGSVRFKTVLATQMSVGWSQWNSGTVTGTSSLLTGLRLGIRPV